MRSFEGQKYTVTILEEDTILHRAGIASAPLGQYFTRSPPASVAAVRVTCAVKDDWDSGGVTLGETLAPRLDTVFSITVPRGTVVYEGRAAPLDAFVQVDALAAQAGARLPERLPSPVLPCISFSLSR